MTTEDKSVSDYAEFFQCPGLFFLTFDFDGNLLWKHPLHYSPVGSRIIDKVQKVIHDSRSAHEWTPQQPVVHKTFELSGSDSVSQTYLATILMSIGEETQNSLFKVLVHNITQSEKRSSSASAGHADRSDATLADLGRFIHELTNPLSIIFGFTEYVLCNMDKTDPNRKFVQEILSNSMRIKNILESFPRPHKKAESDGNDEATDDDGSQLSGVR